MPAVTGTKWTLAQLSLRVAQVLLLGIFLKQAYPFLRSVYYLWGAPELIWYEFNRTGITGLVFLVLFVILRFSKTVVATVAGMGAFVGILNYVQYQSIDDLYDSLPFCLLALCLTLSRVLEIRAGSPLPPDQI